MYVLLGEIGRVGWGDWRLDRFRALLLQIAEAEDLELVAGIGAWEGDGLSAFERSEEDICGDEWNQAAEVMEP